MSKTGGRKAKKITIEEFKKLLIKRGNKYESGEIDDWKMGAFIVAQYIKEYGKDLSKVVFDFENTNFIDDFNMPGFETAYFEQKGDLTFIVASAAGDWEEPVIFCLYVDPNNTIRGYIPEDGNTYNKKYKTAYGSEEESSAFSSRPLYNGDYPTPNDENLEQEDAPDPDKDKLYADICKRIKVVE